MATVEARLLRSVANHIVLPPDLPGHVDKDLPEIDGDLLRRAQDACIELRTAVGDHFQEELRLLENSLDYGFFIHTAAHLDSLQLQRAFRRLRTGEILLIHIDEQNAGLLVRNGVGDWVGHIVFEAVELSAQAERVLQCTNALQWNFPTSAAAIPADVFADESFQQHLSEFLKRASVENIKKFGAVTRKARSGAFEPRDTANPALITGLLIAILEGLGRPVTVRPIPKRIRDEVRFKDALVPWRRSPFWLLLRVGMLRHLEESANPTVGRALYKAIMCLLQSRLLAQAVDCQTADLSSLLLRKICRRMAKMETDQISTAGTDATSVAALDVILRSVRPMLRQATRRARANLQDAWNRYKAKMQRRITPFRTRFASPEHLRLTLINSEPYLQRVRQEPPTGEAPTNVDVMDRAVRQIVREYSNLAQVEDEYLKADSKATTVDEAAGAHAVAVLADDMASYLSLTRGRCYEVGTVERSRMILVSMWLWVMMDQLLCRLVPESANYRPIFHPRMLDCVLLLSYSDLKRLHEIQTYLAWRHAGVGRDESKQTIYDPPRPQCFAERCFDSSLSDSAVRRLYTTVQEREAKRQLDKENEWAERDAQHQRLTAELADLACEFTLVGDLLVPEHDADKCRKCGLTKKVETLRIERIEKALPRGIVETKAVLVELQCQKFCVAYRNATWSLAATLGLPNVEQTAKEPFITCQKYYAQFCRGPTPCKIGITLASRTKSFLQTHYRYVHYPVPFEKVCVDNGLRFEYYDTDRKLWPAEHLRNITFDHHCWVPLPRRSPFAQIDFPQRLLPFQPQTSTDHGSLSDPSKPATGRYLTAKAEVVSNEVLAALPGCPPALGKPEFTAFLGLLADRRRLWPAILVELGSSNLNFSSDAVVILLQTLSHRTGPPDVDKFHATNLIFRDESFCVRLLSQIDRRVSAIASNWRESHSMEVMLGLTLKVISLGSDDACVKATPLLEKVRLCTLNWIRTIRRELWWTTSTSTSTRLTRCMMWAALLCRRTFTMYCSESRSSTPIAGGLTHIPHKPIVATALVAFLEASITLHENLAEGLEKLPPLLRSMLIRDLKMATLLQERVQMSIYASPRTLIEAMVEANAVSGEALSTEPTSVSFEGRHEGLWATIDLPGMQNCAALSIEFHLVTGALLLNGRSVEKELPPQWRHEDAITRLFPNQRLVVYPSTLLGMTYKLAFSPENHEIHLGYRRGDLIVRAWAPTGVWEYVPANLFERDGTFDLPASLVDDCVHWLHLHDRVVEVRKLAKPWRTGPGNWTLDLVTRVARRRQSFLLDPHSNLFHHFASVFRGFEDPRHITVFQPSKYPLAVELRRHELTFVLNQRGLLECRQLHAEIDENQDAGVWYGLSSQLVLRDVQNPRQRSVLVPLGPPIIRRRGMHVDVEIQRNDPALGRYYLDEVLGRVTCASEPRLYYTKALLYACTSFCLSDPLTGKTGADEACHILQAGGCQPYAPASEAITTILDSIANLTPKHQFYPEDLRVMETVTWIPERTVSIQDERYLHLVNVIKQKSDRLALFELEDKAAGRPLPSKIATSNVRDAHLVRRAQARRLVYQPLEWTASATATATESTEDLLYRGRGYHEYKKSEDHVFEVVHLIHRWPAELPYIGPLHLMMQQWPSIAGYGDGTVTYDKIRLSDHLDLNLASSWGPLVNMCRRNGLEARYKLIFLLATISFREEIDMRAIHTLMAFCLFPELKCIDLPSSPSYIQFRPGFRPRAEYVKRMLSCCALPFTAVGGSSCSNQRERKALAAAQRAYELQVVHDLEALVTSLSKQWPCPRPDLRQTVTSTLDLDLALSSIAIEWHTIFEHHTLEKHLWQVQAVLDRYTASHPAKTREILPEFRSVPAPRSVALSQLCLRDKEGPLADLSAVNIGDPLSSRQAAARPQRRHPDLEELNQIVAEIPISRSTVRQEYFRGLRHSMVALETYRDRVKPRQPVVDLAHLDLLIASATTAVDACMRELVDAVKKNEPGAMWLEMAGLWPPLSRVCVLETLRSIDPTPMTPSMRRAIIALGLEISQVQRLLRIQDANRRGRTQQVEEEVRNSGHTNWDVEKYADWLLLEIDADIMIRPIQAEVAFQIISPASGSNSVLQLNMGEGKTSTIIPLVASILANGKSLCRVVVPKALLLPTAQLLQARLGGLLGRELCHVPFSRRISSSREQIETYQEIHASMLKGSGVVIALPEHIMSFMLSGQQRLLDGKVEEGIRMVDVQRWLSTKSRDVYDESDFTMAVKTQLIYPSGPQLTANGGTCRWRTIQMVLKLVYSHLSALEQSFESSIQVVQRQPGAFPFIHFLRTDVQHALTQRIVTDICDGRTTLLNVENFLPQDRMALQSFITEANPPRASVESVSEIHRTSPSEGHVIYLLRGLLVHRLLILTLSRRWNVQYGLHPHPARALAVPYLSKGVPSNLAEWGHVDVSLLLTCLSFYYQGLSPEQLQQSLEQISQSDDPAREYEQWVQGSAGLSDSHRDWTSINIEDTSQVSEIWCGVRYSMTAIDHFLNHLVFPQHAKQFKVKLQASGWDLPLAGRRVSLTTGFSGTNDNRLLLPLTIKQDDMEGLAHTNAEVLTYLLQSRNRAYSLAGLREVSGGKIFYRRLSEFDLLYKLYHMGIRILLDAGALILEMTNATLARMWLEIDVGAEAAVSFDKDNKAWVVTRAGRRTPLLASSYAEDLSACLVYLDESHTRGTDMKFPTRARGAVTLSLGQTKDHTVQAVIRLRQLATTQSITFFAPPEVHQSILDFRGKVDGGHLDSHDVVCWLLEQTCQGLENLQPLCYAQGVNYCRRTQAAHDHPRFITDPDQRRAYLESLQDPEEQSLKSLYGPRTGKAPKQKDRVPAVVYHGNLIRHVRELERRRKAFRDTGNAVHASALQEVEQEREVAVEAETIRERQRPVFFPPTDISRHRP
ncbi:uncharacterized protein PV07_02619 [Cladophialophora immunda]|uniref:ubiquitinyl hydrolase 1 n=1 Tax=Cladophialophora immunda TaxID=569365 RepID=A0A0D2CIH1_9EURO|nr:uncharacterized protein PV07_02619 [Cladophialophora immunda]KIW30928.1 hypothetical protein PV07_02619 [Cladophialophora immunda]